MNQLLKRKYYQFYELFQLLTADLLYKFRHWINFPIYSKKLYLEKSIGE
nr:MAG TPA: hypothetical protein [Caudoviricetes sp.]